MTCRFSCDAPCFREILDRLKRIEDELTGEVTVNVRSTTNCFGTAETKQFTGTPLTVIRQTVDELADAEDSRFIQWCAQNLQEVILNALQGLIDFLRGEEGEEGLSQQDLLQRIYAILGGNAWTANGAAVRMTINPEQFIESRRDAIFPRDDSQSGSRDVSSLVDLIASLNAVQRHRSGEYRLPAEVPADITDPESDDDLPIYTALGFQEWMLRQMDAVSGAYPLKIRYKDEQGEESELIIQNQAEAQAELIGLLIGISGDTDILIQLGLKGIRETVKTHVSTLQAADFAKGNAEYLGYRQKERERELPVELTFDGETINEILSQDKIKVVAYENDDRDQLPDYLKRHSLILGLLQAALIRPWDLPLPGEGIGEETQGQQDLADESWTDFLNSIRDRSGVTRNPNAPEPDIRTTAEDPDGRDATR